MQRLWQNLQFGARMLRKNLGFTLAAVLTLGLGIGGNSAIFTVTSALLLKPLPYQDPKELVMVAAAPKEDRDNLGVFSLNRFEMIRDRNHSFSGFAAFTNDSFDVTGHGEPLQVSGARVSPNFFEVLGIKPEAGRSFVAEEGQPSGKPVVMISDSLWRKRFGGRASAVGEYVDIDSVPSTIIGVLPPGFQFSPTASSEVWSPRFFELSVMTPAHIRAGAGYLTGIARLRSNTSVNSAAAEMEVLNRQYQKEYPKAPDADPDLSIVTQDLQQVLVANIRTALLVLSGAVGFVLLIACANVASLLLSRALARTKEIAVRSALGANRGVLITQLLTESVLLSLLGGALGLALSFTATFFLSRIGNDVLPQGFAFAMDARVLTFTLLISLLTGLLFGVVPALQLSKVNVNATLRDEGRGATGGRRRSQLRSLLVVGQVAFSLLLLIGAGLLIRSFVRLMKVDSGIDSHNVLTMSISLPSVKYAKAAQQIAFYDEAMRRISALPGVRSVAMSAALPLTPRRLTPALPEGQPEVPLALRPVLIIEAISPEWFKTMRVPLKAGRDFTEQDNAEAPKVLIANEALAHRYWPNENPIGKHVLLGRQTAPAEVVGVAADVKNSGLAVASQPQLYLPFPQLPWGNMNLLVRTDVDPHSLVSEVRAQVAAIDPEQPVTGIQTIDELLDSSRAQPRFTMLLLGAFSATALVLAVVGIYGVLAYSVTQRQQEMGVRLALGATRENILRLIVGQGLGLALIGVAAGLLAALALTRVMVSMLYDVSARDFTTFALTPLAFVAIALLACYLPARRATQADPTEALRRG